MTIYPEEMQSKCIICGKNITYPFPLCREHIDQYGSKPEEWEDWMRELWNMKQKSRRAEKKARKHEVSFELLEETYTFL
jgi:hypothetical protein